MDHRLGHQRPAQIGAAEHQAHQQCTPGGGAFAGAAANRLRILKIGEEAHAVVIIVALERAGFARVGFISEPPPGGTTER